MASVFGGATMPKREGAGRKAKPEGEGKTVRLSPGLVAKARAVAQHRGITIGDYFLELTLPTVNKDYAAMLRELEKGSK
jgi:hypothetical protein